MAARLAHFKPVLQLDFVATEDGKPIGRLKIKQSTIQWKPKGKHQFSSVSIAEFSDWIVANGKKATK